MYYKDVYDLVGGIPTSWKIWKSDLIFRIYIYYKDVYDLVGGIPTPWKIWKSDWIIIPIIGENKNVLYYKDIYDLVGGIPTPLKNDGIRQLGWWNSQYMEK